jgi:hypothetical protein
MRTKSAKIFFYSFCAVVFSIALSGCTAQTSNNTSSTSTSSTITTTPPTTATTPATSTPSASQPTAQKPATETLSTTIFGQPTKTTGCKENNGLPDLACTPGALNSAVTQDTIKQTICVSGYTATIRPSTSYTNNLKTEQIIAYGYSDTSKSDYEEDHFIPLEIGGSPDNAANLWPEPYSGTYGAKTKDKVENYLHTEICNGSLTLAAAQQEMQLNWETVYTAHYGTVSGDSSSDSDDTASTSSSSSSSSSTSTPAVTSTPATTPAISSTDPQVKKSTSGICHEKRVSQYYNQTKTFTPYNSIADCLASGGRLPK